jgi:hypothetical protein
MRFKTTIRAAAVDPVTEESGPSHTVAVAFTFPWEAGDCFLPIEELGYALARSEWVDRHGEADALDVTKEHTRRA